MRLFVFTQNFRRINFTTNFTMRIKKSMNKLLLTVASFCLFATVLQATHIVGGEVNYTCLGGDLYEISLKVYRDCAPGNAGYDDPAPISIFDANGNIVTTLYVDFTGATQIPPTVNQEDPCVKTPTGICVEVADYKATVVLPSIVGGYTITYQRCCRNNSVSNLVNPGNVGSTYTTTIPENPSCNSNPQFKEFPPIFVCAGFSIQFDHSATDADGDSLYYSLCSPLTSTRNPPNPNPPAAPPYTDVPFQSPYSVNDPLGGTIPLSINPQTGALTGTPDQVGQYVVGVCVSEYRNGVLLSTLNRDFQFNVLNCEREVVASAIGYTTNCNDHTVQFNNNSLGAVSYLWNFGDPTTTSDTSTSSSTTLTYTYPDTGTYAVTLIAFSGVDPSCNDTLTNLATVVDTCGACNMTLSLSKNDADCNGVAGASADTLWNSDFSLSSKPDTCSTGGSSWFCPDIGGCGTIQGTFYDFLDYAWICGTDTIPTTGPNPPEPCSGGPGSWNLCVGGCTIKGVPLPSGSWYYVCPGGGGPSLGDATVIPSGGTPPYNYSWNTTPPQTSPTATNLEPGVYTVTVTDASGSCIATDSVVIDGVGGVSISTSSTDVTGCGFENGTATVTPSGGNGPYSYRWIPGDSTTASISGLAPGSYTVIVMDNDSCTASEEVQVNNPFSIPVSITDSSNVSCNGGNDGSAIVTPSGGFAPYTYNWSAGLPNDSSVTGLSKGFYTVTVIDSAGCEGSTSVNIEESNPITLSISSDSVSCNGGSDGKAIVVPSGGPVGFSDYIYIWSPSNQTTDTASSLAPGSYTVIVSDSLSCGSDTATVTVFEPSPMTIEAKDSSTIGCAGGGNGIGVVDVSGGVNRPYNILWCDGQITRVANGLSEGFCTITITDNKGCVAVDSVEIVYPPSLALDTLIANASCFGSDDGSITVSPSGGKPAYTFLWNTGDTTQTATNLAAPGTYTVTVTDAIGCDSTISITISEPALLDVILTPSDVTCPGLSNGSITSTVTGGTPTYTYSWSPGGETTSGLTNIPGGTYDLTVTDVNGCDSMVSATIIELPNGAVAGFDTATIPVCEGLQVTFTNLSSGATTYLWDFGDGITSTEANPTHIFEYGFSGTVILTASSGGCSDTYTLVINAGLLEDHLVITAPNVFTPNGDGLNDCFNVDLGGKIKDCSELTIFNRWGNKIFSDEVGACWDGNNAGAGTYFYIIKVNETTFKGSLTLLK